MQVSKLLEIATANNEDFSQIYEAVKDEDVWEKIKLDSSEKDKIQKAVELVDKQTYELMVPTLSRLKSEAQKVKLIHENKNKCDFDNQWSCLYTKVSSTKIPRYAWFSLYYEYVSKEGPWGLGMYISLTELNKMDPFSLQRGDLEKTLKNIVGGDWNTTAEMRSYWKQIGISEEIIDEEIEDGGCLRFKQPLALLAGDEIAKIHERILEVGRRAFIQKIPELKKFWQNELREIEY